MQGNKGGVELRRIAVVTLATFVLSFGAVGCGGGAKPIKSVDASNNVRPESVGGGKKGDKGSTTSAPPVIK